MAITRKQNVSAATTSVAITSTAANDIIVVWAYSISTTIPTLPAGFTNIVGTAGTQQSGRLGYKVSTGGDTTSGTWTNASNVVCLVYSGQSLTTPFGTTPTLGAGNGTALSYSAVTLLDLSGNSVVLGFGGAKAATAGMNGSPTGTAPNFTTRTNQTTVNGMDTAATGTNLSAQTLNVTTTGRWHTVTVELRAPFVRRVFVTSF